MFSLTVPLAAPCLHWPKTNSTFGLSLEPDELVPVLLECKYTAGFARKTIRFVATNSEQSQNVDLNVRERILSSCVNHLIGSR